MGRRPGWFPPTRSAAAALAADGAVIIDLRDVETFAAGHADGAINLGYGHKIGYWAGWVLPADTPLLLMGGERAQAQDAFVQLLRVGFDRVEGTIDGGFEAWQAASLPVATTTRVPAADLRDGTHGIRVIDVRTAREWQAGHLPGSINIPVGELPQRLAELPRGAPVATICESGYRSSLAASLLSQEGVADVRNVAGGMAAYREVAEATR